MQTTFLLVFVRAVSTASSSQASLSLAGLESGDLRSVCSA